MSRRRARAWLTPIVAALLAASLALVASPSAAAKEKDKDKPKKEHKHEKVSQGPVDLPKGKTKPLPDPPAEVAAEAMAVAPAPPDSVDLRVLVLAADGTESDLPAIVQALDYIGTPYDLFRAAPAPTDPTRNRLADPTSGAVQLTEGDLATSTRGRYNAVILTNGSLSYFAGAAGYQSALTPAEWSYLRAYEARFKVRQVSWYTFPTAEFGFGPLNAAVDTSTTPLSVPFTAAGRDMFSSYVNTATPVSIRYAYTYLAPPLADGLTTPILSDAAGNALAAVRSYPDGREGLALTFDSSAYLLHNLVLSYGLVNWATRGMFLGVRRVYLSAQVDDIFIASTAWAPTTPCGTPPADESLPVYRMTGDDFAKVEQWQGAKRSQAPTQALRLNMAFNGSGTTPEWYATYKVDHPEVPATDSLTPRARMSQGLFNWISHTYTHANLDDIPADEAEEELALNDAVAANLGLSRYTKANLVQPEVSGLGNPTFLAMASNFGVRDLVSDVSRGGTNANPSPNAGNFNALQPNILQIPRRANNLYYNVSTPAEWLAEDNCIYPVGAFGHVDTYDQLLERESNVLMSYMLLGDIDPWMFHQGNLRFYDGTHSLLTDLLDRTLAKYSTYFTLPVVSPTMEELALRMVGWMRYISSGVSATATGSPTSVPVIVRAVQQALAPVTGVRGTVNELYGGQYTTVVLVGPDNPVTLGPAAKLSPASLDFGTVKVGKASDVKTVTLKNDGTLPLSISAITTTGDFSRTHNCGTGLATGASCAIKVTFTPTAQGTRTGSLVVSGNVMSIPQAVTLRGTGKK